MDDPTSASIAIFRVDTYYEGLGGSNIAFKKLGRIALNRKPRLLKRASQGKIVRHPRFSLLASENFLNFLIKKETKGEILGEGREKAASFPKESSLKRMNHHQGSDLQHRFT